MSLMTYVIRFSDETIWKRKIHKSEEFNKLQKFDFIDDEKELKKYITDNYKEKNVSTIEEHMDYGNFGALFAPYDYGIVFVDFIDKKIYSYNEHSGFMNYDAAAIKFDIRFKLKEIINEERIEKYTKSLSFNLYEENEKGEYILKGEGAFIDSYNIRNYSFLYNLNFAISKNADVKYCEYSDNEEEKILEKSSLPLLIKDIILTYEDLHGINQDYYLDRISIQPRGWKIISSDNLNIKSFYEEIKNEFSFSTQEKEIWNNYMKDMENLKKEIEKEENYE